MISFQACWALTMSEHLRGKVFSSGGMSTFVVRVFDSQGMLSLCPMWWIFCVVNIFSVFFEMYVNMGNQTQSYIKCYFCSHIFSQWIAKTSTPALKFERFEGHCLWFQYLGNLIWNQGNISEDIYLKVTVFNVCECFPVRWSKEI